MPSQAYYVSYVLFCTELAMAEFPIFSTASPQSAIPKGSCSCATFDSSLHTAPLAFRFGPKIVHVPIAAAVRELEAFVDERVIIPPWKWSTTGSNNSGQDTHFFPNFDGWLCVWRKSTDSLKQIGTQLRTCGVYWNYYQTLSLNNYAVKHLTWSGSIRFHNTRASPSS